MERGIEPETHQDDNGNGRPQMSHAGHDKERNPSALHRVQSGETSDAAERRGTFAPSGFRKFQILVDGDRALDAGGQLPQFKKTRRNPGGIHPITDCGRRSTAQAFPAGAKSGETKT